jgi:hypothetical protein
VNGLIAWGGDPRIVATRAEIDRAAAAIGLAESRLLGEVQPFDFLVEPVHRVVLALHLPGLLFRLEQLKWACGAAGDAYLSTEARVAERVHWVTRLIAQHPVLEKLIPSFAVEKAGIIAAGAIVATQFVAGDASKMLAREFVDVYPALTGVSSSVGDTAKAGALAIEGQLKPFGMLDPGKAHLIAEFEGKPAQAPDSIGAIATRLQSVHNMNEATVLVEKYKHGRQKMFVVYVPGTRDKTILPSSDPFDLSDAVALLAKPDQAASQRAVLDAMHRAGIKSADQILMVGYSQGGTIAGDIAQGHLGYKPLGLVTFGAPIAQLNLPLSLPVLAVEHSNDIVPALSGRVNPLTNNWLTVEREVPTDFGEVNLHAHRISEYVSTATMVDTDQNPGVTRVRGEVMKLFENYKLVGSTNYQYER